MSLNDKAQALRGDAGPGPERQEPCVAAGSDLKDITDRPAVEQPAEAEMSRQARERWPVGYEMLKNGLWFKPEDGSPMQLAGPFTVLGLARNSSGSSWGVMLKWTDRDGCLHRHVVPHADLIGVGLEVLKPLLNAGFPLYAGAKRAAKFKEALSELDCNERIRLVDSTGWYNDAFVLPHLTFGEQGGEQIVFCGSSDAARYAESGTLDQWCNEIAARAAGNSRLVLAIATAFAGPLAALLQEEGGGVHLVGVSSSGKTTGLLVGGSVWGGGSRAGFAQTWRATDNALEAIARAHSGTVLVLDELGELDARVAGRTAYMLVNGQGKGRASVNAELRARPEWCVTLLSSGEISLADKILEGGGKVKAGQLVRMIDIPADAGKGLGLFEDTKGKGAAIFSKELKEATLRYYGTSGPAFVEALADNPETACKAARKRIAAFTEELLGGLEADGQTTRVAQRLALFAVAGEMAREALALPWPPGEAEQAVKVCFGAWYAGRGGGGPAEYRFAVEALREAIERHGESRFRDLDADKGHLPVRDLLGYRFEHHGETIYGFTASGWREVLNGIADRALIAAILAERRILVTSPRDKAHRLGKKVDGKSKGLFAVRAAAITEEGEV